MRVDFCLPVWNEEKILEANLIRFQEFLNSRDWPFTWQIIVIINGSSDSSLAITDRLSSRDSRIKYLDLKSDGKGLAVRAGFRASSADLLVFMDIDLAVSLNNIPDLLQPLLAGQQDLVFGSRLLVGSNINRSFFRGFTSQVYNFLSRFLLDHSFADLQCGFKALRREVFQRLEPDLRDNQWFFDTELIILAKRRGYRLLEIPVDWQENRYAQRTSKIRPLQDGYLFLRKLIEFSRRLRKINF